MRKLVVLPIALLCFLAAVRSAFAQTASLTATVRVNPLEVKIVEPSSVPARKWFDIEVEVSNLGTETVTKTFVTIYTSPKLTVKNKKKKIGNLGPKEVEEVEIVKWRARAKSSGEFVVQVEVTGRLEGEVISATDSKMINVFSNSTIPFFNSLFKLAPLITFLSRG